MAKLFPQIHAKYKIWKNKHTIIPIKGPILASKYRILALKSPCIPYNLKPWPILTVRLNINILFLLAKLLHYQAGR